MELYPLFFYPQHIEKIWGGKKLADLYNRKLPANNIGESWEISGRPEANSRIQNGPLQDIKLSRAISRFGSRILGSQSSGQKEEDDFPLLFKIIAPKYRLSVQVHPDEKMASTCKKAESKMEMWYVLEAEPGAKIIYGLEDPEISAQRVIKAAERDQLENLLNYQQISQGDTIFIAPGMVHALLPGAVIAEIQHNSDTTYRLYDWNRDLTQDCQRPLHLQKAKKALAPDLKPNTAPYHPEFYSGKNKWKLLSLCRDFTAYKINIKNQEILQPQKLRSFMILFCHQGKLLLNYRDHKYKLSQGSSCLLPAELSQVEITGRAEILLYHRGYNKSEFRNLLEKQGISAAQFTKIPGVRHGY